MKDVVDLLRQILETLDDLRISFKEYISTKEIKKRREVSIPEEDGIFLDEIEQRLIVNGYRRQLTYTEFVIMNELIKNQGRVCTYSQLCEAVYGYVLDESSKSSIRSCISRLRNKTNGLLEIKNVKNIGFTLKEVEINART